ncbi:conserved hypothetical protein [uncultured Desulfobacterium sp.]|uniref:SF3 helicase domain-containing protein n=1 Tax=uncultured Desulfobacterium sp. TaxID=201089 RepID=A0A445MWF9_9BACT|nr:conserved hypothetical protein [uncultured Desulfobacterium sp.]
MLTCEAIGYSLLSECLFEKFFLLIGPGANGKSVLLDVLIHLLGKEQTAGVQPSQFGNRFQRAHLFGKLINVVTELSEGLEIPDGELKSIVSGEMTTVEFKHRDPFNIFPFATCWFASNHLPRTRDFSPAFFRRAIVIPFNRIFSETEQDERLKDKLREELTGILNLSLEAMKGVFLRGHFTKTASSEVVVKEWRIESDQVQQFAMECCRFGPGLKELSGSLYQAYTEWARQAGIKKVVNRNNFTARMNRLGAESSKGTGGARLLSGVCLEKEAA